MTTINFEEDLKIDTNKENISIYDFLNILDKNGLIPKLEKLSNGDITNEIKEKFLESKKSTNRINI